MVRLRSRKLIRGGREGASCLRGLRKDGEEWLLTSQEKEAAQEVTGHQEPLRGPGSANRAACGTEHGSLWSECLGSMPTQGGQREGA